MSRNAAVEEIASLKSRIATLEQLLEVHEGAVLDQTDRLEEAHQVLLERSELLRALVSATDPSHRNDFFHALVYHLAAVLKVRYAVVGELCSGDPAEQIRTIAVFADGEFASNFTYDLRGMPCARLVQERVCYFEDGVQQRFPQAQLMKDLGVEGYCGIPIYGKTGSLIGVLAVLDTKPLHISPEVQSLLRLFASRAGAELERRSADEALRKSEERHARAIAAGKVGVWEMDVSAATYHGDANLKAMYGYEPDELSTDPLAWYALIHPDDQPIAFRAWQAILAGTTETYHCELRMVRKDGSIIWTDARGHAVRDANGRIAHLFGATVDITERKHAEQERLQALADLQNIMETIPDVMFTLDTQGNLVKWNSRVEKVTGYAPEELRNKPALAFVATEDQARTAAAIQETFASGYAELEGRLLTKDGRTIPYHWTGAALKDPEGRIIGITGVGRDMTERERAEASLLQRSRQQQVVAELGQFALRKRGLQTVMDEAVRRIAQTLETEYCKVLELRPDGTALVLRAGVGWRDGLVGLATVGAESDSQAGYTLSSCAPVIVEDLRAERRFSAPRLLIEHGVVSGLSVIIQGGDRPWGVLGAHTATRRSFTQDDVNFVQAMANILGAIIERNSIEEALRESEARFAAFMAHLPGVAFMKDVAGRHIYVNEGFERLFGMRRRDWYLKTNEELFPPDVAQSLTRHDRMVAREKRPVDLTETTSDENGTRTWLVKKFPVTFEPNGPALLGGIAIDITERTRAEDALRASEERFAKAFRLSAHLIGITDIDSGRCLEVNDACLELFGYRREEVIGQTTLQLGIWPNADDRRKLIERLKAGEPVRNLELSLRTRTGELRHILVSSDLVELGGTLRVLTVGTDITERKRVEEALRQRERDLRAAIEARERISQDLHDGILQSLYAVGLNLEACKPLLQRQRKKTTANLKLALDQAIAHLNQVMRQVRNFIAGLESDLLRDHDLPAALRNLAGSLQSASNRIRLAVDDRAAQSLSTDHALHILNVAKEAVSNSLRHSHARQTAVSLKMLKRGVRLTVRDDGVGFRPDRVRGVGHGLANMAARAEKIGGRLTIRSKPKHGTWVIFDLPKEAPVARV